MEIKVDTRDLQPGGNHPDSRLTLDSAKYIDFRCGKISQSHCEMQMFVGYNKSAMK